MSTQLRTFTCRWCSEDFETPNRKGQIPYYCDPCRPIAKREQARVNAARWRNANREKVRSNSQRYYRNDPERYRGHMLKTKYNITLEQANRLLAVQGGGCAICKVDKCPSGRNFSVDHARSCCAGTNSCGKCVRGLLCRSCNSMLMAGYEALPKHLQTWPVLNEYIERDPWLMEAA